MKTLLPPEAKEALGALAVVAGQSTSEYVRDRLMEHVYGKLHMMRLLGQPYSGKE